MQYTQYLYIYIYTIPMIFNIAIEHDHGNSGFPHWKWWIFPVRDVNVDQRVSPLRKSHLLPVNPPVSCWWNPHPRSPRLQEAGLRVHDFDVAQLRGASHVTQLCVAWPSGRSHRICQGKYGLNHGFNHGFNHGIWEKMGLTMRKMLV